MIFTRILSISLHHLTYLLYPKIGQVSGQTFPGSLTPFHIETLNTTFLITLSLSLHPHLHLSSFILLFFFLFSSFICLISSYNSSPWKSESRLQLFPFQPQNVSNPENIIFHHHCNYHLHCHPKDGLTLLISLAV